MLRGEERALAPTWRFYNMGLQLADDPGLPFGQRRLPCAAGPGAESAPARTAEWGWFQYLHNGNAGDWPSL